MMRKAPRRMKRFDDDLRLRMGSPMNADEFDDLAAKCLLGEASAEEQAQLDSLLTHDPEQMKRFLESESVSRKLRESAPLLRAANVAGPIPLHHLEELNRVVQQQFAGAKTVPFPEPRTRFRLWTVALPIAAGIVVLGVLYFTSPGNEPSLVQLALGKPLKDVLRLDLLNTQRGGKAIALYCPRGTSLSLTPIVRWRMEPGRTYDLSIRRQVGDKAAPFEAKSTRAPVEFSNVKGWEGRTLEAGRLYKVRLTESGSQAPPSEYDLDVHQNAQVRSLAATDAEKIERARQALMDSEPRFGDALAELLSLPEAENGELVLRMKLVAFGQLGLKQEHDDTLAQLKKLER